MSLVQYYHRFDIIGSVDIASVVENINATVLLLSFENCQLNEEI